MRKSRGHSRAQSDFFGLVVKYKEERKERENCSSYLLFLICYTKGEGKINAREKQQQQRGAREEEKAVFAALFLLSLNSLRSRIFLFFSFFILASFFVPRQAGWETLENGKAAAAAAVIISLLSLSTAARRRSPGSGTSACGRSGSTRRSSRRHRSTRSGSLRPSNRGPYFWCLCVCVCGVRKGSGEKGEEHVRFRVLFPTSLSTSQPEKKSSQTAFFLTSTHQRGSVPRLW